MPKSSSGKSRALLLCRESPRRKNPKKTPPLHENTFAHSPHHGAGIRAGFCLPRPVVRQAGASTNNIPYVANGAARQNFDLHLPPGAKGGAPVPAHRVESTAAPGKLGRKAGITSPISRRKKVTPSRASITALPMKPPFPAQIQDCKRRAQFPRRPRRRV